jgi:hypothetical protein
LTAGLTDYAGAFGARGKRMKRCEITLGLLLGGLLATGAAAAGEPGPKPPAEPGPKPKAAAEPAPAPAPAPAPKAPAEPAPPAKAPVAPVPAAAQAADARAFVRELYKGLESGRGGVLRLGAMIDPELLFEEALRGLSSRPPEVWLAGARKRVAGSVLGMAGELFPSSFLVANARVVGSGKSKSGAEVVSVRFYRLSRNMGEHPGAWHQVHVVRTPAGWRISNIDQMDSGQRLSDLTIARLTDPRAEKLPLPGGAPLANLAVKTLAAGLLAAVVLGLAAYLLLVRPAAGKPGRGKLLLLMWVVILGPALTGAGFFFSGLMEHMDRGSALEEFKRRGKSLRGSAQAEALIGEARRMEAQGNRDLARQAYAQAMGACKEALSPEGWRQSRWGHMVRARVLVAAGDRGAEAFLRALTSEKMDPPMPSAHLELAVLYQRQRRWSEAGRATVEFAKQIGEDAFLLCRAAQQFAQGGDFKNADGLLEAAERAQDFDNPKNSADFDHLMVLSRAAVRAKEKRGKDTVADFRLVLGPFRKDPVNFHNMGMQLLMMARSRQFQPLHRDKDFLEFVGQLHGEIKKIRERLQKSRPGGGKN